MDTQTPKAKFLASNVVQSSGGGGGQEALFKAFSAVINNSVRVAVRTDLFLRPR